MGSITELDMSILSGIQGIRCGFLDLTMPAVTVLGSGGIIWIMTGVIMCFFRGYRRCGINILAALLIGFVIGNLMLKNIIARERPCWTDKSVTMLISVPSDYSFPSGHTLSAAAASAVIFRYDWRIGIPAVVLAVLTAFSRMYLFVHFPSDILAGAILGIAAGIFVTGLTERLLRRGTLGANNKK